MDGAPTSGLPPRKRLDALDAARWLASAQIVMVHFYKEELGKLAKYGGLWTQFFFGLSGFVLAYSEYTRPIDTASECGYVKYVRKRLNSLYPMYLFTLVLYIASAHHDSVCWRVLPVHVVLMQTWFPICSNWQCTFCWNDVAWFVSVLFMYWFFLRDLAKLFRYSRLCTCCFCIAALWAWTFVLALLQSRYHVWPGFWRRGPLGFLHVFTSGIVSARVFVLIQHGGGRYTFMARYGASIGYLVYSLVLWFGPEKNGYPGNGDNQRAHLYFWAHNGGLLPVHVTILLGCAIGEDPLAKYGFQSKPFRILGRISYAQYLLQHLVMELVKKIPCLDGREKIFFPFVLLCAAYMANKLVEEPCAVFLRQSATDNSGAVDVFLDHQLESCTKELSSSSESERDELIGQEAASKG